MATTQNILKNISALVGRLTNKQTNSPSFQRTIINIKLVQARKIAQYFRKIIMDKKTIIFCILILKGSLIFCNQSYSQKINTNMLQWIQVDSTYDLNFSDTGKALEWTKHQTPLAMAKHVDEKKLRMQWDKKEMGMVVVNSKSVQISNDDFYIVIVEGCSGIPCQNFYIFKEIEKSWRLIAMSKGRIKEEIELQSTDDKIMFETKSGKIGEYPCCP